jgi:DNA-binding transcriptional ArsR family regulator
VKNKELLSAYVETLTMRNEIKSGFLDYIASPKRVLDALCVFLDAFVGLFNEEYALCEEKLAGLINEIRLLPPEELDKKTEDWRIYRQNRAPDDRVCFTHILFLPESAFLMKLKSIIYICIGYKYFRKKGSCFHAELGKTKLFTPLSNKEKFRIIEYLKGHKKRSVGELAKALGIPAPTMSHYLVSMHSSGILYMTKERKKNLYFLNSAYIDSAVDYLDRLETLF